MLVPFLRDCQFSLFYLSFSRVPFFELTCRGHTGVKLSVENLHVKGILKLSMRSFTVLVSGASGSKELWHYGEYDVHCASLASNAD